MPQQASDSNIQKNILELLDKVVKTGVPVEIERKGKRLLISPVYTKTIRLLHFCEKPSHHKIWLCRICFDRE